MTPHILMPLAINPIPQLATEEQVRAAYESYRKPDQFAVGDVVMWKMGFKLAAAPCYGEPCVITDILSSEQQELLRRERLSEEDSRYIDPAHPVFWEDMDVVMGYFRSGTYLRSVVSSARLMRYDANLARDIRQAAEEQERRQTAETQRQLEEQMKQFGQGGSPFGNGGSFAPEGG